MSLKEAYKMAHSAQCRLQMEASRPERNLRFVVGHLMHYEDVRLRIVEIEHDISMSQRASAVKFKGTGHVSTAETLEVTKKPSTGQLGGRKSPPPPPVEYDPYEDDEVDDEDPWSGGDEDEGEEDLGLQRFPSGSARPPRQPRPPPELLPDDSDEEDDDEPISPEDVDQETLEELMKTGGNKDLAKMYDGIRKCPCHKHQDAPTFENMWELPKDQQSKEGYTRAVAQVWV